MNADGESQGGDFRFRIHAVPNLKQQKDRHKYEGAEIHPRLSVHPRPISQPRGLVRFSESSSSAASSNQTTAASQDVAPAKSMLNTRFKRCAQVIPKTLTAFAGQTLAAWYSAGVLISAFVPVFSSLPRLAGVTHPHQWWFGANKPW